MPPVHSIPQVIASTDIDEPEPDGCYLLKLLHSCTHRQSMQNAKSDTHASFYKSIVVDVERGCSCLF